MRSLIYSRLVVLTAGTLLPFFWMIVILGHRRKRNFERIFFFLCLALVFFFGSSLLELNAQLYYASIPAALTAFAWSVLCLGLWFLPPFLVHLHVEYADIRGLVPDGRAKKWWLAGAYLLAVVLLPQLYAALGLRSGFDLALPSNSLGQAFQIWLVAAILVSANWEGRFAAAAPDKEQGAFHRKLRNYFFVLAVWIAIGHAFLWFRPRSDSGGWSYGWVLALLAVLPLVELLRNVQKYNFLQFGRQRNLMYAVFCVFVGLLYLGLIRRVSQWLDPYLPPEATAAILLFLPVVFFEPLQRLLARILRRTAQSEMDRAQRLMGPIQEVARLGNLENLCGFAEKWISEQLQLSDVKLVLDGRMFESMSCPAEEMFPIRQSGRAIGGLRARPFGAMFSGETVAALEFVCEQLPGALDLCRLIEEKLQLERELAERERLAVLGQMAASISHNLKNPLGSIKTILQVQLESSELPDAMRAETRMVLEEISRLATKLNQLLQFSRPAVRGGAVAASCDACAIVEQVSGVLRHEAERRGVALDVSVRAERANLAASAEAVSEILSNLVVNALEATPRGGHVIVTGSANGEGYLLAVEDDGPGVPENVQEKILQPFFTTKTQGTGLGLAIVAKRVADFGGRLEWKSPAQNGKGTRFEVTLPTETQAQ